MVMRSATNKALPAAMPAMTGTESPPEWEAFADEAADCDAVDAGVAPVAVTSAAVGFDVSLPVERPRDWQRLP